DYVYPVHLLDGTLIQHVIYSGFFLFNDVLDAQKIHDALLALLQIGDWKKLGGRLRYKNGKLEIHVPRKYTAERPAFRFADESFDCAIADHPSAGEFPLSSDGLCIKAPPAEIRQLAMGPNFAASIEEMIDTDVPQLAVKITTFTDATLIATSYPHITWDATGYLSMYKMVGLVLEGREDEVLPLLGAQHDILAEMASKYKNSQGETPLLKRMNQETNQQPLPQISPGEERFVCIPIDIIQQLQNRLQDECSDDYLDGSQSLKEDELLLAWAIQQVARAEPDQRPLNLMNLINARLLIPALTKVKGIYTQNMLLVASNNLPTETATGPIGPIAFSQRDCIANLAAPDQLATFLVSILGAIEANIDTNALSNNTDSMPIIVNNLNKLTNRIDIDFSSAIVRQGQESSSRTNPLGTMTFGYVTNLSNPYPIPKLNVLGRFNGDTCWLFGELPKRAWELMEEYLESL
ncbi:hypothetical protein BGW36DRAFT_278848, partial [Talaromyces proteolyticus]